MQGTNIRDHNNDVYNNTIAPGTPSAEFGGGQVRLDRQTFALPSTFINATLTDIRFNGYGGFPTGEPFLAALSVSTSPTGGSPGRFILPGVSVTGQQIIGLSPPTHTVAPAEPATYDVTVLNPTANPVTYALSIQGLPASWVNLPRSITVSANGSLDVPLSLTSDFFTAQKDYGFTVSATGDNGAMDSVSGDLVLQGKPVLPDSNSHGVVAAISPTQAIAGQATSASYVIQLTNTGIADDSFGLSVSGLPAGISASFNEPTLDVPPGVSNFRDVILTLTPPVGTVPGDFPFAVTATSTTNSKVTASAPALLTVVANGVNVCADPSLGRTRCDLPDDRHEHGIGGGHLRPVARRPRRAGGQPRGVPGHARPRASQVVPIATGTVDFAVSGPLDLTAIATSRGNPSIRNAASSALTIGTTTGLSAQLTPSTKIIPIPGTTSFLLLVNNLGNAEDTYSATITGTDGPVSASLTGLDGNPTQSIPTFILPGLSTGAILVNTNLASIGLGRVNVQIKSLKVASEAMTETATVSTAPLAATATQLALGPNPASPGQAVTLSATVTNISARGRRPVQWTSSIRLPAPTWAKPP